MAVTDDDGVDREAWAAACGVALSAILQGVKTTGYWVSQKTGIPYSSVSRYVRGERAPTLWAAQAMCKLLGVTVDHFLARAVIAYGEAGK